MSMGIYCIHNSANGKNYIGKSKNLARRKYQHFSKLENNEHINTDMQADYNKYGHNCFLFEVLETVDDENKLDYIEDYYIKKFDSLNNGYNRCRGNIKSVLNTTCFTEIPTFNKCYRSYGESSRTNLQDYYLFHQRYYKKISIEAFLDIYSDPSTQFFLRTEHAYLPIPEKEVPLYYKQYEIRTKNLKVSDLYITLTNEWETEALDLYDKWKQFVQNRNIKYMKKSRFGFFSKAKEIKRHNHLIDAFACYFYKENGEFVNFLYNLLGYEVVFQIEEQNDCIISYLRYVNTEFENMKEKI